MLLKKGPVGWTVKHRSLPAQTCAERLTPANWTMEGRAWTMEGRAQGHDHEGELLQRESVPTSGAATAILLSATSVLHSHTLTLTLSHSHIHTLSHSHTLTLSHRRSCTRSSRVQAQAPQARLGESWREAAQGRGRTMEEAFLKSIRCCRSGSSIFSCAVFQAGGGQRPVC